MSCARTFNINALRTRLQAMSDALHSFITALRDEGTLPRAGNTHDGYVRIIWTARITEELYMLQKAFSPT